MNFKPVLLGRLADDVDHHVQGSGGPVEQPAGEALVGEHEPDRGEQVDAQQRRFGAVAVLPLRGQDGDADQQAEGVSDDESLTPVDFL